MKSKEVCIFYFILIFNFSLVSAQTYFSVSDSTPEKTFETITFYGDYNEDGSFIIGANCQITYNSQTYTMHSAETTYYWQDEIISGGNLGYSVTCSKSGHTTLTSSDSAYIDSNYNTYFVDDSATTDSGDGSVNNPKKYIYSGIQLMNSGDTLIIKDGMYTNDGDRIRGVPSGSAGKYTIIKAENDFGVILHGLPSGTGYVETPINFYQKSYIVLEGVILKDVTGGGKYALSGITIKESDHIKIRKVGIKNGVEPRAEYGGAMTAAGCSYCLFEDVFATGMMRDGVSFIGGSSNNHNIMRRVVVRWDYCTTAQPRGSITIYGGYQGNPPSEYTLQQNCIVLDSNNGETGSQTFTDGFRVAHEVSHIHRYGSISLNQANAGFHSAEDSLCHDISHTDCVLWDSNSGFWWRWLSSGMSGCYNCTSTKGISVSTGSEYAQALDNVMVDGANVGNVGYEKGTVSLTSSDFDYIVRSPIIGKGANIENRHGISGTLYRDLGYDELTSESLWPFPNEDKIKELFSETNNPPSGYGLYPTANNVKRGFCAEGTGLYDGPITLTSYIWEYLDNECPPEICNYNLLTCTDAGGTCQTNSCSSYQDCISLSGTCSSGNCCSGTCTEIVILNCTDSDGDGFNESQVGCGVVDCNDLNLSINPGATEVCGNGVDEDCSGSDLECPVNESEEEEEVPVVDGGSSGGGSSGGSSSTPECVFTNAFWSVVSAVEGEEVLLTVEGTNCDDEEVDLFVIWEDDLIGDDSVNENPSTVGFSDGKAVSSWTVEYQDDFFGNPEYYFVSTLKSDSSVKIDSRDYCDLLMVDKAGSNMIGGCPNYVWTGIR
ncbi:MAG: MopE-related protein [archaeon]